jgi:hypothetical protein
MCIHLVFIFVLVVGRVVCTHFVLDIIVRLKCLDSPFRKFFPSLCIDRLEGFTQNHCSAGHSLGCHLIVSVISSMFE